MTQPVRIAIADDHALFRQGMRLLLETHPRVAVVGEAENVDSIAPMLAASPCDVLLLDLKMDRSALPELSSLAGTTRIVVVTATENPREALEAVRAGARAVVFKRYAADTLMHAIRAVARGEVWLPTALQAGLLAGLGGRDAAALTPRERDLVRCVAEGMTNAEIARSLFISVPTVKRHLNNVFDKLGLGRRAELVRYAVRTGLVDGRAEG